MNETKYARLIASAILATAASGLTATGAQFDINGSNGWIDGWGVATPNYVTDVFTGGASPLSGNAALVYEHVDGDPGRGVEHDFATPLKGLVDIKFNMFIPVGHNGGFFVAYGLSNAAAEDLSSWGGAYEQTAGCWIEEWNYGITGPSLTRGVWQEIKMHFDFDAGTAQYFKDGVAIGSPKSIAATATNIKYINYQFQESYMGTDSYFTGPIYFDNFSVDNNGTTIWSDNFDSYIAPSGPTGPVNDNFADAIALRGNSGTRTGSGTVGATFEAGEPNTVYPGVSTNTVWFKWVCTQTGTWTLSTTGSSAALIDPDGNTATEWDSVIGIYTGASLAALTAVLPSQDTGVDETVILPVTAGTTYYVQLSGCPYGPDNMPDDASNILLTWSLALPPAFSANAGPGQSVSAAVPSVQIGGNPTASHGIAPYTYSWSPTTNLDDATLANPTASPTSTTVYTVTVTDAVGTVATSSETVTYVLPNANLISVDFVEGSGTPCSGDTIASGALMNNAAGISFAGQTGSWNRLNIGSYNNGSATSGFLNNGAGTATTVKLLLGSATGIANPGGWRCNPNEGALGGASQLRSEEAYLYNGVVTGDHYVWAFTGLTPNASYKMVWFGDIGNASGASNVANSVAGSRDSEGDWNWDTVSADADGKIIGLFTAPNPTLGLYGAQIEAVGPPPSGYDTWAATNAGGQTAGEDFNHDGVANGIAYFMGETGRATNPGVVNGKVTWPHVNAVSAFEVQVSTNLIDWTSAASGVDLSNPAEVVYTLPTGTAREFCRLVVTP